MIFEKTFSIDTIVVPRTVCSGKCDCSPNEKPIRTEGSKDRSKTLYGSIKKANQNSVGC